MATSFTHQVGGHPSTILSSPLSSSTLIKPASTTELEFYQSLGPKLLQGDFIKEWCPAFYGTLKLQGNVGGTELNEVPTLAPIPSEMLVLENLTHRFRKPNVLDIKLGQILYDEHTATPDKIEKMKRAAERTTSGELGLRLTGFQVWDSTLDTYVQTPKPFGRTLTPSELDLGLSRFFYPPHSSLTLAEQTCATSSSSSSVPSPSSPKKLDELPIPPTSFPPPLPLDLLLPILRTIVRRLQSLVHLLKFSRGHGRDDTEDEEGDHLFERLRMIGTSLLVIIEGDRKVLERSLRRAISSSSPPPPSPPPPRTTSEGQEEGEEEGEEEEEEMDEEGNALEESLIPFEIKLIDFAHTTLEEARKTKERTESTLGETTEENRRRRRNLNEVQEGVLKGVENFKDGLERLVKRLEEEEEQ